MGRAASGIRLRFFPVSFANGSRELLSIWSFSNDLSSVNESGGGHGGMCDGGETGGVYCC